MAHRGIEDRRIALASEVVQLERQLRLLIEAAEAFVKSVSFGGTAAAEQALQDRLETAKAHLS